MFLTIAPLILAMTGMPTSRLPLQSWEEICSRPSLRWIVVGEQQHGTNEMPEIFADLVKLASRHAPVIVAVEQPEADQNFIDDFILSDGGPEAEAAFLKASMWRQGQPESVMDGRSSQAVYRLFGMLRELHKQGRVARVIAFEPNLQLVDGQFQLAGSNQPGVDLSAFEKRMAAKLQHIAPENGKVLVFTGAAHARLTPLPEYGSLGPMASHLPPDQTFTLQLVARGNGEAWQCLEDGCGPHATRADERMRTGIVFSSKADRSYSASLYFGKATTVSLPMARHLKR